jgi:hypothetical protein
MFLYKFEVLLSDQEVTLIVMGDNDEESMNEVEVHLTKHFVKPQDVREIVLVEKRRAVKGAAYVIE